MEFTVKRSDLFGELTLVQGVIEKKSTIPILSNILLEASGDHLGVTATDLDVSICCGCPANVQIEGTTTVSARRLHEIVRLLPEDADIRLTLLENEYLSLQCGNSKYKIVGLPKENFPSIPEPVQSGIVIPGAVLGSMIQRTMFAITQEESRYSLNGAQMVLEPGKIKMVATDGHRLALVMKNLEFPAVTAEMKVLIPRKTLIEMQKLLGEQDAMVEFGKDDNHLFFGIGGKRLVSRILAGQFPNYEMVIPRDNDKNIVASSQLLADGIRRAAVMSDEKLKAVKVSISTGTLELTASSAEAGEARDVVPVQYEGSSVDIGFNPRYLLDFLAACGTENVILSVRDSETQGLLSPDGPADLEYSYVVMPMKF
jgi:DNA polymerase III subunit beta